MNDEQLIWEAYQNSQSHVWDEETGKLSDGIKLMDLDIDQLYLYLSDLSENILSPKTTGSEDKIWKMYGGDDYGVERAEHQIRATPEDINRYFVDNFGFTSKELETAIQLMKNDPKNLEVYSKEPVTLEDWANHIKKYAERIIRLDKAENLSLREP